MLKILTAWVISEVTQCNINSDIEVKLYSCRIFLNT